MNVSSLCLLLGIDIPIIQAPAGSVAGPELAAAVSSAGGLGSLGVTWTSEPDLLAAIRHITASTSKPFLVNYALAFPPDALSAALDAGVPVVSFSWGDATHLIPLVRDRGAKAGVQIGSLLGAKQALDAGADFLICQGVEAGGHVQSTTALNSLLESVVAEANGRVPVVAAGGLATGQDIAAVLSLGAAGVMLGTRFVATRESRAHDVYKRALIDAGSESTTLTICFDGGWTHAPHRVLRNSTFEAWEASGCPPPGARPGEADVVGLVNGYEIRRYEDTAPRINMVGDLESMALYAGTGVERIRDLQGAFDLTRSLWAEVKAALAGQDTT